MSIQLEAQYGGRFGRFQDFMAQIAQKSILLIQKPYLVAGIDIAQLPDFKKLDYAFQVCAMLSFHQETMLQFKPETLIDDYISKGLTAIVLNEDTVLSFGKLYPWPGVSSDGKVVFELGSWITKKGFERKGYGGQVVHALVNLAHTITPNAQVVALTEVHNAAPQKTLIDLGGIKIGAMPSTVKVLLGEGKAELVCFDMSHI